MPMLKFEISTSLDGYAAGPSQSEEDPLGEGGEQLHEWVIKLAAWRESHGYEGGEVNASTPLVEESQQGVGAVIMGRNMFGGGPGPWGDDPWQGWWGNEPPFRMPVFVLTHHEREPLTLGETTFTFVTDGIESALEQAREAAGEQDVAIGGGAEIAQQYLAAGLIDQMQLNVVPILLGDGARLFENGAGAGLDLEPTLVVDTPEVTHLRYRVGG
jgi:dihydrofolate reductase